ncbi:MAG: SDR family NAD(P)-dependent oxidoreductase [Bacilli bacterium]|nr:SDR family NAD(P)-dependent oxidoreductase [Bacilli bacterium]
MKTIIVTGSNSGIGKQCAMQLASLGHRVIMACRNQERGEAARDEIVAATGNKEIFLKVVDLSEMASVRTFISEIQKDYPIIDVLINNAADFDIARIKRQLTSEGLESQFATNVVAPFLLSASLLSNLEKSQSGKIINISSQGLVLYPFLSLNLDNLNGEKKYNAATQYYQNKLALLMLSLYIKDNVKLKTKIHAIRVTNVKVDISRYPNLSNFQRRLYTMKSKFSISANDMAKAYVSLALDDNFDGFYVDENLNSVKVNKGAYDQEKQIHLIKYLMEITGLSNEFISFK